MLPTDALQRPPGIGNVNRLVSDAAKIAMSKASEQLEHFIRAGVASQTGSGDIDRRLVPLLHCRNKCLARLMSRWQRRVIHSRHRPISLFDVPSLGRFE